MSKKRKVLLVNTVLLTLYLFLSVPYYLTESSSLEGFAVASALYLALVFIHEVAIFFALCVQWLGYLSYHRFWIVISSILLFLGGIAFPIAYILLIPIIFVNLLTREKEKNIENNTIEKDESLHF
jgi:hypothetical protein